MRLGIISDTHGCVKAWEDALKGPFQDVDLILHAGDVLYHGPRNPLPKQYNPSTLAAIMNECSIPILAAKGNCDSEVDQMVLDVSLQAPYFITEQPIGRVLVTHGHTYSEDMIQALAQKFNIDIWVSGHTHVPGLQRQGSTIYLNPGSPSLPKGSELRRSVALITQEEIQLIDLDSGRPYENKSLKRLL